YIATYYSWRRRRCDLCLRGLMGRSRGGTFPDHADVADPSRDDVAADAIDGRSHDRRGLQPPDDLHSPPAVGRHRLPTAVGTLRRGARHVNRSAAGHLRLEGLSQSYGGAVALRGASLEVRAGEFVTLLGPSGSGKTTTLKIVAGFIPPDTGRVILDGRDLTN